MGTRLAKWSLVPALAAFLACGGSTSDTPDAEQGDDPGANDRLEEVTIPWEDLPRLPTDREFTTAYAAGTARRLINPEEPEFLGGFGICMGAVEVCRTSQGVHDDVAATAVAIADVESGEVVIFVGVDVPGILRYDMDMIHSEAREAVARELGLRLEGERLMVGASHTHSGVDMTGMYGPMMGAGRSEEYAAMVRDKIVEAAVEALGNLADVEISWGRDTMENYDKDDEADDMDVWVVQGRTSDDATLFTLARWNAHPTAYWEKNLMLSSDYPGVFRAEAEKRWGGTAVFFNGPLGSVYPVLDEECQMDDYFPDGDQSPAMQGKGVSDVACLGTALTNAAGRALQNPQELADTGIRFRFQRFQFHPENETMFMIASLIPIHWEEANPEDPESLMTLQFSWVTLGDLDFLTTPGEPFPSYAADLVQVLSPVASNVIVLGLTQDWVGYLLSADQWATSNASTDYHKSLSPGSLIAPEHLKALQALVDAETNP